LKFSNWKGQVGKQEPGGEEESKSQLEGVSFFFFFFFMWKQDHGILSPTEGIFHLLLSDWALVVYKLN
jgi:hypothetical protein